MEGIAEAQRRLSEVFNTSDFTVTLHDGPLAGQEVPHVHFHVMPRTESDGGLCAAVCTFPKAPAIGSVEPDFAALGSLAEKLQAVKDKPAEKKPEKGENKKAAAKGEAKKPEAAKSKEEDPEAAKKALLKKVKKEGGKRGVEIEGAADMGGLQFFCTSVEFPDGDLALLKDSVEAMNEKSDPTEEERKGGSGAIGKMVFSAGTDQLAVLAYVPEDKLGSREEGELVCEEWLKTVLANFQGTVTEVGKSICLGVVKADSDKNVFPLKIREPMILEANNYLRKLKLFPEDDGDSDEMVFGDDDFPSM